ncbi:MAG: hypothetical protein HY246_00475 [Proteobacteria bacterium]|nr:hypothetical protein [Pseudomonadota bacterium]
MRPLARQRRLPAAATIVGAAARLAGVAAVAIMLVYAELKWQWTGLPGEAELPVVTEPINDAITFRLSGRPLDVSSSSPTALASWFKGKTDFSFPTVPARLAGFKLQGIRLCYFLHRRLAAVLYQNGNRALTLYVMSGEQLDLPADSPAQIETGPLWLRGAKGYSNLIWRDGSTVYALVSELSGRELLEIAKELQSGARSAASIELKLKTLHSEASRASDRSAESA